MGLYNCIPGQEYGFAGEIRILKKLTLNDLSFGLGPYNAVVFHSFRTQEPGKRLLIFEPLLGSAIFGYGKSVHVVCFWTAYNFDWYISHNYHVFSGYSGSSASLSVYPFPDSQAKLNIVYH